MAVHVVLRDDSAGADNKCDIFAPPHEREALEIAGADDECAIIAPPREGEALAVPDKPAAGG